jgi:hypothetical protein
MRKNSGFINKNYQHAATQEKIELPGQHPCTGRKKKGASEADNATDATIISKTLCIVNISQQNHIESLIQFTLMMDVVDL